GRVATLFGRPGRGKTHLAIAIAYRAAERLDARFTTAAELVDDLSNASRGGRMREVPAGYVRPHVLVVDEVGHLTYGDDAANVLYHGVNDRHIRRKAMLFTTNKPPRRWERRCTTRISSGPSWTESSSAGAAASRPPLGANETLARRRARRQSSGRSDQPQSFWKKGAAEFPEPTTGRADMIREFRSDIIAIS